MGAPSASAAGGYDVQIKILDWGLARFQQPKGSAAAAAPETAAAGIIGTADYLAPEQARYPDLADIRSDIYSLGCTFYFLLTGQPPFPDGSLMQKLLLHQNEAPLPLDLYRRDIPQAVSAIVARMLAKKPEDRFQTPASVALALAPHARSAPSPTIAPAAHGTLLPAKAGDTVTTGMDDSKK
jgi:serine/threonine-protein kinase